MLSVPTKYFGILSCREEAIFEFPRGLPAFEDEKRFVLIELRENSPLVFLQSLLQPTLCFLAFPILVVDRQYGLAVPGEDLAALDLDPHRQPALGAEVLALALLSLHDGFSPTANLMAPVVLNLKTRRGLQAIRQDQVYSHQHVVESRSPVVPCPVVPCPGVPC
jgi:flagellar assembly factor FliW